MCFERSAPRGVLLFERLKSQLGVRAQSRQLVVELETTGAFLVDRRAQGLELGALAFARGAIDGLRFDVRGMTRFEAAQRVLELLALGLRVSLGGDSMFEILPRRLPGFALDRIRLVRGL